MSEASARFWLPLLVAGQGQKDITHNEAVEAIDSLLHPLIVSRERVDPPLDAAVGDAWLVPEGATGVWLDHVGRVAFWTVGGWRYLTPREGYSAWLRAEGRRIRLAESGWRDEPPFDVALVLVADPVGGTVIDVEARATLSALLAQLADVGLINASQ